MQQATTRVEDEEYATFRETAAALGTTPADAIRIFIYSFNDHHGFPFPVQSRRMMRVEPFATEEEATAFATELALGTFDAAR